jgi:two-component system LytT family sensor kinase
MTKLQVEKEFLPEFSSRLILWHILAWFLFILYEISFIKVNAGPSYPLLNYVCYYPLNILLFYFNAHVIMNYAMRSPMPVFMVPVMLLSEILTYLFIKYVLDYFLANAHTDFFDQLKYIKKFLGMNGYRCVYFLGFSSLYWSVLRMLDARKDVYEKEKSRLVTELKNIELERNLAEAQNAYLQHQINPHLLFNTLGFIHNTVRKCSEAAAECVLLLSDIMRFSLSETNVNGKIELSEEIEQLQNFIEINQRTLDDELPLDFQVHGNVEDCQIIPLILLTLTENIIKHGYLKRNDRWAYVRISINEQKELTFHSWNLKSSTVKRKRIRSLGIQNVIKRLDYSYKNRYRLDIDNQEESYELHLTLQL